MSQATEYGLEVGKKYVVTCSPDGNVVPGDIVIFTRDDGSGVPEFAQAHRPAVTFYLHVGDVNPEPVNHSKGYTIKKTDDYVKIKVTGSLTDVQIAAIIKTLNN